YKSETEVIYDVEDTKLTDLVIDLGTARYGVSVVRALVFPAAEDRPFPPDEATRLLTKKLGDIQVSSENVSDVDAWDKQILSVIADTADYADVWRTAWDALDADLKADTVVFVTVTEGDDAPLY
ncbi:MAG TPA: hypothetical protein VGF99_00860, partial [Myxococcota bacterium]